jgi:KDO2-lipid IV(A) lauroyltransferase
VNAAPGAPPPAEPPDPVRDARPTGGAARLLDLLAAMAARMPLAAASAVAWLLAWTWWWVLPIRRRVAVENLRAALPDVAPRPVLTRMMHDLVLGYVELLQFDRLRIEVVGAEGVRGAVLVGGHGGAWDLALLGWARAFPVTIFLRTPTNAWVRGLLTRLRDEAGVHRLETGAGMDAAYRALAAGRNVFFVQDQRHNAGPPLPFFGRPAHTSLGAAAAVARTGCPVYGAWQWRVGTGHHRLELWPLAAQGELRDVTNAFNTFYAQQIAARPHGWLWLHDRWKPVAPRGSGRGSG